MVTVSYVITVMVESPGVGEEMALVGLEPVMGNLLVGIESPSDEIRMLLGWCLV